MNDNNIEAIEEFIKEWEKRVKPNWEREFTNLEFKPLSIKKGRKYAKIIQESHVVAFIDMKTGDIFKPAGWSKPAKHARGNIFSKEGGFEAVYGIEGGHFFVRYLK